MGEWMTFPGAEDVIAERTSRFGVITRYHSNGRRTKGNMRICNLSGISGLAANIDWEDIANLADVGDVPLWECEIPLSDDGF